MLYLSVPSHWNIIFVHFFINPRRKFFLQILNNSLVWGFILISHSRAYFNAFRLGLKVVWFQFYKVQSWLYTLNQVLWYIFNQLYFSFFYLFLIAYSLYQLFYLVDEYSRKHAYRACLQDESIIYVHKLSKLNMIININSW